MLFKVSYDKGSRLRIKLGSNVFNKNEGYGLENLILTKHYVNKVKTSPLNGSILIEYDDRKNRDDLVKFLQSITLEDFESVKPNEVQLIREINNEFLGKLVKKFIKRFFYRRLIPFPIKRILTLYRAASYINKGIDSLIVLRLDVSLLDALAIGTALLNKSFKSASSAMFLLGISEMFEEYAIKKTKTTLKNSLAINIDKVWLVTDEGTEIEYPLNEIKKGDKIKIRMGELIAVDGKIVEGEAMINEASMTGEPLPIQKSVNKTVHAGTVVEEGTIIVEVCSVNEKTRINKIIDLIENSEQLKAGVQSRAEKLADGMVPYSLALTGLTYILSGNINRALSVLMVDYSCAIKLAIPLTVMGAMHEASNHQLLVKGGKHLESYALADTIIFDKTGTLTYAVPKVVKVIPTRKLKRDELLKMAACIEEHYAHSVARAIVNKAYEEGIEHEEEHSDVQYIVAHGISTEYHGKKVIIGSKHFIVDDEKVRLTKKEKKIIEDNIEKYSIIYLAIEGKLEGIICIDDPIRDEAKEVISQLRELGIEKVIMLTGDSDNAAKYASETLGIDEYKSQVLPEDKFNVIEKLKKEGHKVIMVGDGINDSPALSVADVSVAMNGSSDIAREVADIGLMSDDLHSLVTLRKLSMLMLDRIDKNYKNIIYLNSGIIALGILGISNASTTSIMHNFLTMAISGLSTRRLLK